MRNVPAQVPTIKLHANSKITDDQLTQVLLGVEEESVPIEVVREDELNPLELAHNAAIASSLGIGIGISLDYVVVTTEKLPTERPYMATWLGDSWINDRHVGENAARLVKRTPLLRLALERSA
ncbi:glycerol dehydratase reactivase beta/small subunit family protein [Propionimicrobium lymphophilum]|uniref:Glycerol dehydratase reactivation factor, small subunit n=1 Tax=Propionimicrobium lymphophilum ACS-093-V-SCH5 TaxID=883161 RepID=S2VXN9_9ACTN|nr:MULTISPECIES: glycerol dehydratase reactivase beta/small subunit family protein [Propionimicrobium]EPD32243.1 hypothetical protein HMPREF9306_01812 [Propionimicrobium lymphophilum ACS-093-V-SCH5]ETJ97219.1 dehydratase medium subunit [Propionimicrobium sp. BV2F7]MDK7709528.1 glycerol dehydratase reactivase beta/small subunit family protein [Propionimicrobium lymphophilum]MDK7733514.1 glycerol dehydratase reactivase beta/small subunit family protein [Propionimicrobium lymphophilum]